MIFEGSFEMINDPFLVIGVDAVPSPLMFMRTCL